MILWIIKEMEDGSEVPIPDYHWSFWEGRHKSDPYIKEKPTDTFHYSLHGKAVTYSPFLFASIVGLAPRGTTIQNLWMVFLALARISCAL